MGIRAIGYDSHPIELTFERKRVKTNETLKTGVHHRSGKAYDHFEPLLHLKKSNNAHQITASFSQNML